MSRRYDVGIYVRLSVEDAVNSAKRRNGNPFQDESASIENQKAMLTEYVMLRGWNVAKVYADDGYSGGSFHRPGFLRMVEDARAGLIDLVLVKDLSRLGRDYLEVGRYTGEVFPELGCRFIALMDDIDSEGNDDLLPFRSLLNDYHLKDLSRKIKSVLHAKAEAGEYIGAYAPYGYIKDPECTTRLIVDSCAAEMVRRIFWLRSEKTSYRGIAAVLNREEIPAPRTYWFQRENKPNPYKVLPLWREATVKNILNNEVYLGHSVKLKKGTRSYKDKTFVDRPKEAWARVENTHEAIIDRETWDAAQRVDLKRYDPATAKKPELGLFTGLLFCSNGHPMIHNLATKHYPGGEKKYRSYLCGLHKQTGTACSWHTITETRLLQFVREDMLAQMEALAIDEEGFIRRLMARHSPPSLERVKEELRLISQRIAELSAMGASLYEDRLSGAIAPETFQLMSAAAEAELLEKQAEWERLEEASAKMERLADDISEWIAALRKCLSLEQPDRIMLHSLIRRIEVGEGVGRGKSRRQDIRVIYRIAPCVELQEAEESVS